MDCYTDAKECSNTYALYISASTNDAKGYSTFDMSIDPRGFLALCTEPAPDLKFFVNNAIFENYRSTYPD